MFTRGDTSKPYAKFMSNAAAQQQVSKSSILRELQNRGVRVRNTIELDNMIKEHIESGNLPSDFKPQKKYSSFDHGPVDHFPQWTVDFLHEFSSDTANDPLMRSKPRSREERMAAMNQKNNAQQVSATQQSLTAISPEAEARRQRMQNRIDLKK